MDNAAYFSYAEVYIFNPDPELYIFSNIGFWNIWPIEKNYENYDEVTLFSVIEFFYEHIYRYKGIVDSDEEYSKNEGQEDYRNLVNGILRFYNGGYELSEDGEILKLSPPGFETMIEEVIETNDPKNIDSRVRYSIFKYSYYGSSAEDKKEAVRTLADVLEYLREIDIKLPKKDDGDLFNIINNFDIRHHRQFQKSDYDKDVWYDWMFYTFLASIYLLLKTK